MVLSSLEVESVVLSALNNILTNKGEDFDDLIESKTRLVQDLNFSSMDFIELVVLIEENCKKKLGFHDLLMENGRYIDDLTVGELEQFVNNQLTHVKQSKKTVDSVSLPSISPSENITPEQIVYFRETINSKVSPLFSSFSNHYSSVISSKNPPLIFVLCPPRSGSTLLRVILAGHPKLFAPPELHLLSYPTLKQRKAALSNEWNFHLQQGTLRGIMQLKNCSVEVAQQWMQTYEDQNLTTQQFYGIFQAWCGDKILVDKSPTYASHPQILGRAEKEFENPLYIHLVRHPLATIRSYTDAKLNRIVPFMNESSFSQRQLAELTWLVSQENILNFLARVPQHRQLQVKFEDLVSTPEQTVSGICEFLGLDFDPKLLDLYEDKNQRMTDGIDSGSLMSGDLKFHLHKGIDPQMADRWKQYETETFLSETTPRLAKSLGYEVLA